MNLFSLINKTAVVSGGYGHLGKAMTEALLDAGATVYVLGRSHDKFLRAFLGKAKVKFQICDITQAGSIKDAVEEISRESTSIEILINNAISAPHWTGARTHHHETTEIWGEALRGGIMPAVLLTEACLPLLKMGKYASIINIGSMYGLVSPDFRVYLSHQTASPAHYAANKGALIQWTRYMACELASHKIRVNCISPGAFPKPEVYQEKEFIQNLIQKVPLGRLGEPEELKGATVFLASQASAYVTGQNLSVDGGWTAW